MTDSEGRIDRLEARVQKLEINSAVDFERHSAVIKRLDKIDGHISKLVWLIMAAIVGGFMTFILNGGLSYVR